MTGWSSIKKHLPDFAPLRDERFRLFFVGQVVSTLGDALVPVATAFAVLRFNRSGTDLGIVLATLWMVRTVSSPFAGVVADRLDPVKVMLASDLIRAAAEGFLAVVLISGHGHLWEFVTSVAVYGVAGGLFGPASMGFVQSAVPDEHRQNGNASIAVSQNAIAIIGPGLSGIIAATGGYFVVYAGDGLTFLFSALCLWRLAHLVTVRQQAIEPVGASGGEPEAAEQSQPVSPMSSLRRVRGQLAEGLRAVNRHSWLWYLFNASAFTNLCTASYFVLGPLVAAHKLGGVEAWGAIGASAAVGALVGALVSLRLRFRRPLVGAYGVMGTLIPLQFLALASGLFPLVIVAAFLATASISFGVVYLDTAMQSEVEREVIARVDSIDGFTSYLPMPFGLLGAVAMATALGTTTTLIVLAGLAATANLVPLMSHGVRSIGQREPSQAATNPKIDPIAVDL